MRIETDEGRIAGDLHVHTVCSDGSASVEYILGYAERIGLAYISVTDHDTLAGSDKALKLVRPGGVKVIPGVEISARDERTGRNVHILCYYPKDGAGLQSFLDETLARRRRQKLEMAGKISRLYPGFSVEAVEELSGESEAVYECHLMQLLCNLGYTNTAIGTLMEELISSRGSCYVRSSYPSVDKVAEVIKDVGGIAVIAHPEQFDSFDLAEDFARRGLIQGVEVWHPRNSAAARARLREMAGKYRLLETGGSDFHGQYAKRPNPLGACSCTLEQIERLLYWHG